MRPKYVAKLPVQAPSPETNRLGGPNVSRDVFHIYAGSDYPSAENLMSAVHSSRIIKEWAESDEPLISRDFETANYVEIRRRPKTYFGKYVLQETVYLETIAGLAEKDSEQAQNG